MAVSVWVMGTHRSDECQPARSSTTTQDHSIVGRVTQEFTCTLYHTLHGSNCATVIHSLCVVCVWIIVHKGTETSGVLAQSVSLQAEECFSLSSETCFICLHSTLIIQQMLCNTPQHTPTPITLGAQPILAIGADVGVLCVFICVYNGILCIQ